MPKHLLTYRCLVISPGDVREERDAVTATLERWNSSIGRALEIRVEPVRWETHARPELGRAPQDTINHQIVDGCDFGIAVFGSKLGTPTAAHPSGSVEEVERLHGAGARVMVYFSSGLVPRNVDVKQFEALRMFKESVRARGLYFEFQDESDLRELVTHHVTTLLTELATQNRHPSTSTTLLTMARPDIRLSVSNVVAVSDIGGGRRLIALGIGNHSPVPFFFSTAALELGDHSRYVLIRDAFHDVRILPRILEPGNSLSIGVDARALARQVDFNIGSVGSFVVSDAVGRTYRTDAEETKRVVIAGIEAAD